MLAGPTRLIKELRLKLGVNSDCSGVDALPKLGFIVGGRVLNLMPSDYVDRSDTKCEVSLMSLDIPPPNGPLFIFGIPFLQRFYTKGIPNTNSGPLGGGTSSGINATSQCLP